jgi:hypothetical protein
MQPLRLKLDHQAVDALYNAARTGTLDAGLVAFGFFVTGYVGYALIGGHAMRVPGGTAPLVGRDGPVIADCAYAVPDPVLREIGVEWLRNGPVFPTGRRAEVGVLILRAGLLARILDRAFRHLEPRESGGQRTLQHQLVKACFVESFGAAEQVRQEAPHLLDPTLALDLPEMHRGLSSVTMKASKLMGGHGYLLGETNSIEFLSLCMSSIAGRAGAANRDLQFSHTLLDEAV